MVELYFVNERDRWVIANARLFLKEDPQQYDYEIVYDDFTTELTDILLLLNGEFTGYLYLGRDTCVNCLMFNQSLKRAYYDLPGLEIYKFDTDFWRDSGYLFDVLNNYTVGNVPALLMVNDDGTFVRFHEEGESAREQYESLLSFLTEGY